MTTLKFGSSLFLSLTLVVNGETQDARPVIKKVGTIDHLMVETTPVVFKNRLYRFEYVRDNYHTNKSGVAYFRFIDVSLVDRTLLLKRKKV